MKTKRLREDLLYRDKRSSATFFMCHVAGSGWDSGSVPKGLRPGGTQGSGVTNYSNYANIQIIRTE